MIPEPETKGRQKHAGLDGKVGVDIVGQASRGVCVGVEFVVYGSKVKTREVKDG